MHSREPAPSEERLEGLAALRAGRLAEAISICERGIERTRAQDEQDEFWRLCVLLSQSQGYQGEFGPSVAVLEAAPLDEGVSVETRVRVLNQKAFALGRRGDLGAGKEALEAALNLATKGNVSPALVAEIEVTRSTLLFYLAKHDEVETCARAALKIATEENLPMVEASACAGVGKSYMYRERHADAISWFQQAAAIYEREGATFYADIMRSELGCCHFALREFDKAFTYFAHALSVSRQSGALASLHIDLANMGCLHLCRGEYAPAISHFEEALRIARQLQDVTSVSKWLSNLALAYSRMGNLALAKTYELEAERVKQTVAEARTAASRSK